MKGRILQEIRPTAFLLAILLLAALPAAADIIIGFPPDSGTGNRYPFGSAYSGEYQQVYSHTQFSGPITITNLEFYNTEYNSGATAMNSGNWMISLSTTSADWNTLSPTYANNIGANNTLVFNGNLYQPWAFGNTLQIILSTPFTYDPAANGNLLMDVFVSGASAPGGYIYFDTNGWNDGGLYTNTFLGRVYGSGGVSSGYGLMTGFSTGATGIPEPGLTGVLALALAGMGIAIRRRRIN
jgi:hypothetical protein